MADLARNNTKHSLVIPHLVLPHITRLTFQGYGGAGIELLGTQPHKKELMSD